MAEEEKSNGVVWWAVWSRMLSSKGTRLRWGNSFSISFQIEWNMIGETVLLSTFWIKWISSWLKIERKTVTTIILHLIWKEIENEQQLHETAGMFGSCPGKVICRDVCLNYRRLNSFLDRDFSRNNFRQFLDFLASRLAAWWNCPACLDHSPAEIRAVITYSFYDYIKGILYHLYAIISSLMQDIAWIVHQHIGNVSAMPSTFIIIISCIS